MQLSWTTLPYRRLLFAGFAVFVLYSSFTDLVEEFAAGESLHQMLDDVALFLISTAMLVLFYIDYLSQQQQLRALSGTLQSMRGRLNQIDSESSRIAKQYRSVIQKQFEQWKLSPGEQEIALALIKGLSFREISELRDTREKTVRQQAASVYKKANLSGRHELAGWFFEDLLNPE